LVDIFTRDMQRVAARAPPNFAPQVKDTQKRLGLLFDHLNNGETGWYVPIKPLEMC
jgi:protein transport protein SEC31